MQRYVFTLSKTAQVGLAMVLVTALLMLGVDPAQAKLVPLPQEEAAFVFDDIEQVLTGWSADQHLYVRGDIGVSQQQQSRLESWLDNNAPNWTIVLMDTAKGQRYESVNRSRVVGMDACEYALGHGLTNRTDFGSIAHPDTGEAYGAVFVLYITERKFNYLGSLAQDGRGLGETQWNGKLDRAAIRAMRNGGRIIDAVKDTVSLIDRQLAEAIGREAAQEQAIQERARRIELEKNRQLAELTTVIEQLHGPRIDSVIGLAAKLRESHPAALDSPLAKPPTERWRSQLGSQRTELALPTLPKVAKEVNKVREEIEEYLDDYAAHKSFEQMLRITEDNLANLKQVNSQAANKEIEQAQQLIAGAKAGHAEGLRNIDDQIHRAMSLIKQGDEVIRAERIRLAEETQQNAAIRKTLYLVGGILTLFVAGLLWMLNVRRRPARQRALDLFAARSIDVDVQGEQIEKVVERVDEVLGPKSEFLKKGFDGLTRESAEQTFGTADLLQSKLDGARRSIESASSLVQPANPLTRAMNMVSPARYDECVHHLSGKSFEASAEPGELDWLTFDEFISRLQGVREQAMEQLDELEVSFDSVNSKSRTLQTAIKQLTKLNDELGSQARSDRHFKCDRLASHLLPAANRQHKSARALSFHDPLRAVREVIPKGAAIVDDGRTVAETILAMRKTTFPKLDEASRQLRFLQYETRWIKKRVDELGEIAEQVLAQSAEKPGSESVNEFVGEAGKLGARAKQCVELGQEIDREVAPLLKKLESRIQESREQIARQLSLNSDQTLNEKDCNPDTELRQAERQLDAAKASLNIGAVKSAAQALGEVTAESDQATNLIDATLESLKSFDADHRSASQRHSRVLNSLDGHQAIVENAADRFAKSALVLRAQNENAHQGIEKQVSLKQRLRDCQDLLKAAASTINSASKGHCEGLILAAASDVALANMNIVDAEHWLQYIDDHYQTLDELTLTNVSDANDLVVRATDIRDQQVDYRTREVTQVILAELQSLLAEFQNQLATADVPRDPFDDQSRCLKLTKRAGLVSGQVRADQQAHSVAGSTVTDALAELEVAKRMVHQARNDQVPDSRTVEALIKEVESLASFINEIQVRYEQPHNDWSKVYVDANLVHSRSSLVAGQLRQELLLAQAAVDELHQANGKISEAANWSGGYYVSISDSYGRSELQAARRALAEGRYKETIRQSKLAYRRAESAIEDADDAVQAARRQSNDDSSSGGFGFGSLSSSSSFGSSSSSSSSFGFGSSSSSSGGSSYGSSSSGFGSRSGW